MKHLFTRAFPLAAFFLIAGWIPSHVSGGKELRADLFPRLRTGQSLRYQISLTIVTHGKTESAIVDPEAGSNSNVKVEGTLRVDVIDAQSRATKTPSHLRTRFEKLGSDTPLPARMPGADSGTEGDANAGEKAVEFVFASNGEVSDVKGLEDLALERQQAWLDWLGQFLAPASSPQGGVKQGQKWESEWAESNTVLTGLVWRRKSEYVRNEPCGQEGSSPLADGGTIQKPETCAAILTTAVLRQKSPARDATTEEYRLHGLRTSGTIRGTLEVISYVSLETGLVVRSTASSQRDLDVTIAKKDRANQVRYTSSVKTQSEMRLITETPLAQGLALERNLFLKLCVSESALARMRSYEGKKITSPSRGFEV